MPSCHCLVVASILSRRLRLYHDLAAGAVWRGMDASHRRLQPFGGVFPQLILLLHPDVRLVFTGSGGERRQTRTPASWGFCGARAKHGIL